MTLRLTPMLVVCVALLVPSAAAQGASPFSAAMDVARRRVVKLYGGALGTEKGYGCGVLLSSDGLIVTTLSSYLEAPAVRAVLHDGQRLMVRVLRRDERRQLALLKIDAEDVPYFELTSSAGLQTGDWIIAAANPFQVAVGPEPVSLAIGVLSGRARLEARRRTQDVAYRGEVLLTDVIVATPGSAGGALLDVNGRLVGLIGKAVLSTRTNTWLNYALPVEEVAAFLNGDEDEPDADDSAASSVPRHVRMGIRMFDVGGRTRLAYVERVRQGSAARDAGLRSGDLILSVGEQAIETCDDFAAALAASGDPDRVELLVKRGEEVHSIDIVLNAGEDESWR